MSEIQASPLPKKTKIAWFVTSLDVGGTERQLVALCEGLPEAQFEKHIICLSGLGPLESDALAAGATLHDLRYPRRLPNNKNTWARIPGVVAAIPRLLGILKKIKPDVLHTMIPICNIMGAAAGKASGVPAICCSKVALGFHREKSRMLARMEDWSDRRFDLVHCKSKGILEHVALREPIPRAKMRVVYNGLRLDRFARGVASANVRRELGVPDEGFLISIVANLIPYKGHHEVIEAASMVVARFPSTCFVFVGRDDGIGPELKQQAASLNLEKNILVVGERRDVPSVLCASNMLLSASHEEGFSNVLLEGMAARLPIVATRVGGNPEAVADGETGLLVDAKAPGQLAEAINTIIADPALAASMGARGEQRVKELFSYEAMIKGMLSFYAELRSL